MVITHKLRPMDLTCKNVTQRVDVMQDDKFSRCLALPIRANGADVELPEDVRAVIRFRKPDGTGGNYDTLPDGTSAYTIRGSVITVALAPQVCTVPSMVQMAVCLMRGNAEINTFVILVNVHANPGIDAESQDYTNMRAYVKSYGWPPDKTLRTDADGNVIADDVIGGSTTGGYYTPSVDDDGNLTWTASNPGMPEVEGANIKGPQGEKGDTGNTGPQGPQGVPGRDGKDGADGEDGVGIESVVQTTTSTEDGGTNVITVTKTDGTSSTFQVKNGSKGSTGPAGADGSPGADGAPGVDGYTPVKGTDYFTEAEKQEIAEAAAGMVSIPEKLPNPNALTFTGAVTGSYDGSAPLTVDIPSGGGGGDRDSSWKVLEDVTLEENVAEYISGEYDANEIKITFVGYVNDEAITISTSTDVKIAFFAFTTTGVANIHALVCKARSASNSTYSIFGATAKRISDGKVAVQLISQTHINGEYVMACNKSNDGTGKKARIRIKADYYTASALFLSGSRIVVEGR